MKAWFAQKTANEQKILIVSAALAILLLFYTFIYLPIARENTTLQARISSYQEDVKAMQEMAQQVASLSGTENRAEQDTLSNTRVMTLIEQSAKQQELKITQIKPLSKNRLLIVLDDVLFNATLRWLDNLQKQHHINIEKFFAQTNKDLTHLQITLSY
ncbi:MAG: type II secretion system protein M [Methyloprofundus sp.]|nr:type II secretion system protein M [Methyloprofundus sp.]MDT8424668.1 type II secretion system protein M [Methyloprofundus sp.]